MVDQAKKEQGTAIEWLLTGLMQRYGYMVEPHQCNKDRSNLDEAALAYLPDDDQYAACRIVQPDLSCWKNGVGLLIEVKSKRTTTRGQYGLDKIRFHSLKRYQWFVGATALYAIYDMDLAEGRLDDENAFLVASINDLKETRETAGKFYFWSPVDFEPLLPYLDGLDGMASSTIPQIHSADSIATLH